MIKIETLVQLSEGCPKQTIASTTGENQIGKNISRNYFLAFALSSNMLYELTYYRLVLLLEDRYEFPRRFEAIDLTLIRSRNSEHQIL